MTRTSKKNFSFFLFLIFGLGLLVQAGEKSFSGCWWGAFETDTGNLRTTLELTQEGTTLTGKLSTFAKELKTYDLKNANIGKGQISFSLDGIEKENHYILKMQADGSLAGEETMDGRKTPLKYDRQPGDSTFPETSYGTWNGALNVGGTSLKIVFKILPGQCGQAMVLMDSPDQGAMDLPTTWAQWDKDGFFADMSYLGASFTATLSEDGKTLSGTFKQGQDFPLSLTHSDQPMDYSKPQDPKPPFPYSEEEVELKNGDITLAGTLSIPHGDGPFPAVMMLTGSGAQDRNESLMGHKPFWVIADHLNRNGIAVLRMDDRGVGGSTGSVYKTTLAENAGDALKGVAFLKADKRIDGKNIGLVGHSEGGWMAPLAAVKSKDVAYIVLLAGPGVSGQEILFEQNDLMLAHAGISEDIRNLLRNIQKITFGVLLGEPDDEKAKAAITQATEAYVETLTAEQQAILEEFDKQLPAGTEEKNLALVVTPWFRDLVDYDPREVLKKVTCPVLAIIGELDFQVPPKQNIPVLKETLAGNKNATVKEMPGLNHLFQKAETGMMDEYAKIQETINQEVLDLLSQWILGVVKK